MKTLKMYEIIKLNDTGKNSILIELLIPYKKSLLTYYSNFFTSEPILMVTSVFNACQYGIIVPSNDFTECMNTYLDTDNEIDPDSEEYQNINETISFNSIMLSKL